MDEKRKAQFTGAITITGTLTAVFTFVGVLLISWFSPHSGLDAIFAGACIWIAFNAGAVPIHFSTIIRYKNDSNNYQASELLGRWLLKPRFVKSQPKNPTPTSAVREN